MIFLTKILAVYMLALSLVPCSDGGGGLVTLVNHFSDVEHSIDADHDHSNDCGDDLCSPFCICSCCSSALDIPIKLPFQLKSLPPKPIEKPSFFSSFIPTSFNHSIWQPPKFS